MLPRRFSHGQLIEVNAHSLFSKWFSESGKLVSKLFSKIMELVRVSMLHSSHKCIQHPKLRLLGPRAV